MVYFKEIRLVKNNSDADIIVASSIQLIVKLDDKARSRVSFNYSMYWILFIEPGLGNTSGTNCLLASVRTKYCQVGTQCDCSLIGVLLTKDCVISQMIYESIYIDI